MKSLFEMLPINRKEKFWTSCVLPALITGESFRDISGFLKLIGVPEKFIKDRYDNDEIMFTTEYCLRDSARNWPEVAKISAKMPDVVILLRIKSEIFLIFIEAKMFSRVRKEDFDFQIKEQIKIAEIILKKNKIPSGNFIHVGIFLEKPSWTELIDNLVVIDWGEVLGLYSAKKGNYFYEMLTVATEHKDLMSKVVPTFGLNKTGNMGYKQIIAKARNGENFLVGRRYFGIDSLKQDCQNGDVYSHPYEVNTKKINKPNKNWFTSQEFLEIVESYEIEQN